MPKSQRGFSAFGVILLLLLSATIGFAGWRVYETKQQDEADTNAEKTDTVEHARVQKTETEVANGMITYKNTTLGFSFTYPATWGKEPLVEETAFKQAYTISFYDNAAVKAGVIRRTFQPIGADGSCYVLLGIDPNSTFADYKKSYDYFLKDGGDAEFKTTGSLLFNDDTTFILDHYEAGKVEGIGSCPGPSMSGTRLFTDTSSVMTGIQFFWHDDDASAPPLSQFDLYKANRDAFISAADRQAFIDVVKSAKAL